MNITVSPSAANAFTRLLMGWNARDNNRQMPWKGEKDPYRIWLSEIILQQTRVEQGLDYYNRFIKHYPSVHHLAIAPDEEVFRMWQGLGYYSRCKNLLKTARIVVNDFAGKFPDNFSGLLKLPGVGAYTAAAIASFAFNLPHAVVDGNVYRVLARYFGKEIPTDTTEGKKFFTALANRLLDPSEPGIYNQALMDFGATVCKPKLPLCDVCPLQKKCTARLQNKADVLPVKLKRIVRTKRHFLFFVMMYRGEIMLMQRIGKDIWQHLFQFPMVELFEEISQKEIESWSTSIAKQLPLRVIKSSQALTHQQVEGVFLIFNLKRKISVPDAKWYSQEAADALAMPRMVAKVWEAMKQKAVTVSEA